MDIKSYSQIKIRYFARKYHERKKLTYAEKGRKFAKESLERFSKRISG